MIYILFLLSYNYWNRSIVDEHTAAWAHNKDWNIKEENSVLSFFFFFVQKCKNNCLKTNVIS